MDYLSRPAEKNSCNLGSEYLTKRLTLAAICLVTKEQGGKPILHGISRLMQFRGVLLIFWTSGWPIGNYPSALCDQSQYAHPEFAYAVVDLM